LCLINEGYEAISGTRRYKTDKRREGRYSLGKLGYYNISGSPQGV